MYEGEEDHKKANVGYNYENDRNAESVFLPLVYQNHTYSLKVLMHMAKQKNSWENMVKKWCK